MSPREPVISRESSRDADNQSKSAEDIVATAAMCSHCFDSVIKEFHTSYTLGRKNSLGLEDPDFLDDLPSANVKCPLFVTWEKHRSSGDKKSRQYELRGCIGTLAPKTVANAVGEYAKLSAFNDRRFHPVELQEVEKLRVSVSLLVKYEECRDCHDWTVGVHGIKIQWRDSSRRSREYSATYLPEVAAEQGWDQKTTVNSLIKKAGYNGVVSDALLASIECIRYQSSKCKLSYDDYVTRRGIDPVTALSEVSSGKSDGSNCRLM